MRNKRRIAASDCACVCLYCGLTDAQKQKFHKDAKNKKQVLVTAGYPVRNAAIGAKAEAIFAALFNLSMDDGIYLEGDYEDFILCGHAIEVKGTTNPIPNPVPHLRKDGVRDRVYVFIRVAFENNHAFFQGFAVDRYNWYYAGKGYRPPSLGTWNDFNRTVDEWNAKALPFPF